MDKPRVVAAVWAIGMTAFLFWIILIPAIIIFFYNLFGWWVMLGFSASGLLMGVGCILKYVWKIPDGAVFEKLPKIMRH